MFDIITIGDSTIDTFLILDDGAKGCTLTKDKKLVCFNYAQKIPIRHTAQSIGGNAANVAVGIQKLGRRSTIITELGDDINGHTIKYELEQTGVDTAYVKLIKNKETRYSIVLNYCSERTILSYHAPRNYTLPRLPQTKWIYYTSLGKTFEQIQTKIEAYLVKNPSTKLAVNPGSYQLSEEGIHHIKKLLPKIDILFVNKEEAEKLVGGGNNIKNLIASIIKTGVKHAVITDSLKGSYTFDQGTYYAMTPYPIVAKAKTGAGDAYTSGFLAATMYGKSIPEAMQWGTANAGGVIQEFGAQKGLLSKQKLEHLITLYPRVKPKKI
ncbi:MAG TPA: hypothetical protein DCS29_02080 [Candidatus Magasanikbacteria bacterium]|nr:MAG: hypothetical protein A2479_00400 [Candidatus Magasanikbacteria bacterium RIFOXYC2_FULL_39_8]HAT03544.1 hypothetical protein [Candidatus Magasanikbacteria bacterium]